MGTVGAKIPKAPVTKKQLLRVAPWEQFTGQELNEVVIDMSMNVNPVPVAPKPHVPEVIEEGPTRCQCFSFRRRSSEGPRR